MACYPEEEVWKCPKHPSKRRRNGICPVCLRDRLATLCPICANVRPCNCAAHAPPPTSLSLHRSKSVAIPFLRAPSKTPSLLSILRRSKTKSHDPAAAAAEEERYEGEDRRRIDDFAEIITRSRSMRAGPTAAAPRLRPRDAGSSAAKGKFWHFPSPMAVFRGSKASKVVVHDQSPLHRG
ncbi:Unknown protein [Striga hermonthica]|uniref:Uncharacterized protein n=1 Tax=Striga hermonthica TaxID=68872 RepID=A0A9N7NW08_STRHE|nr:Unknown protein [Striga hermonthica]